MAVFAIVNTFVYSGRVRPVSRNESSESSFAGWLAHQLERQAVDPTDLAARAGISSAYISMLRHGRRQPSYKVVVALANALGVPERVEEALAAAHLPTRSKHVPARPIGAPDRAAPARPLTPLAERVRDSVDTNLDRLVPEVVSVLCEMLR